MALFSGTESKVNEAGQQNKRTINELIVDNVSEFVQGHGDNSCTLLSVNKMEGINKEPT